VVRAARDFTRGTASRKRTTSSALSTTGSFCGSRACAIRSGKSGREGHAIQEAQRADGLVQRRPRHPAGHQVDLKGADILQIELLRRTAEEAAEFGDGVNVGSLGCRRQVANRHVLDHATA
jgi:hypothetical protein